MDYVETEGDTIDEAIENALKILAVERDKVTVDILSEGKRGLLGIGAKKARVRAALRKTLIVEQEPDDEEQPKEEPPIIEHDAAAVAQKGREVLSKILRSMGVQATIEVKPGEAAEETILDIHADCGGLLIGRRGQTLEALQYLVTRIVSERQGREAPHLVVDTENYRERRRKSLEDMALRLGEKAKRQRKTVSIDALSAADRRIIHAALQDDPWVTTKSLGSGAYRRLLIIPEGDRKKKDGENP
jgi:spoIIIJ-associated protein